LPQVLQLALLSLLGQVETSIWEGGAGIDGRLQQYTKRPGRGHGKQEKPEKGAQA
jgi:hypothetical protein